MKKQIDELFPRYPLLKDSAESAEAALHIFLEAFRNCNTLFVAGNGGSGADAEHIAGELLKGFMNKRVLPEKIRSELSGKFGEEGELLAEKLQSGLPCMSLLSHPALNFAFANDVDADMCFAQQLMALGRENDVFLGISTSGNAKNIRMALEVAAVKKMKTVLLTGNRHGCCEAYAGVVVAVNESETYKIQELHLPLYHWWCRRIEEEIYG